MKQDSLVNKTHQKLHFLDSLRGIAALVVVMCHYHTGFQLESECCGLYNIFAWFTNNTVLYGNYAVCLFFVLSGFVLSVHYFKSYSNDIIIKQSIKRYPRLFLPVLGTSFIYWLVQKQGLFLNLEVVKITHSDWFAEFWNKSYTFTELILRCGYDLLFFNEQTFCNNINTSLWTMPIELKYSFILFASLFLIRNQIILWIYDLLVFSIILILPSDNIIYYLSFLMGLNIAFYYVRNTNLKISTPIIWGLFCVSMVIGILPFNNIFPPQIGTLLRSFSGAILIFVALYSVQLQQFLLKRIWVYLGKISFSLYLIHALVLGTVSSYTFLFLHSQGVSYQLNYSISMAVTMLFSIIIAHFVHRFIDMNSIKISNLTYELFFSFKRIILNKKKFT